jgi:translation initiation factor IF-3
LGCVFREVNEKCTHYGEQRLSARLINLCYILLFNRRWRPINSELRVNEEIRAREVRVVSADGEQLGILAVIEAIRIAREKDLDLVEVAPTAKPPVCKIMDYGKYRYEQSRREREARKRQKIVDIKEIRLTPKIETHDFQVKVKQALKFLNGGDKVKVSVRFRGREIVHADLGKNLLMQLYEAVKGQATLEREPKVEGRNMIMILSTKQE